MLGQHCRCRIAGIVDPDISLWQVKVNEAPLIVCADDITRIGVPVNDLSGQFRVEVRKVIKVFFAEAVRKTQYKIWVAFLREMIMCSSFIRFILYGRLARKDLKNLEGVESNSRQNAL